MVTPADCVMDGGTVTGRVRVDGQVVMDVTASGVSGNLALPSPPRRTAGEPVGSPERPFSVPLSPALVTAWGRIHQLDWGAAAELNK